MRHRISLRVPGGVELVEPEDYNTMFDGAHGVDPISVEIHGVSVDGDDLVYDVTLDPREYFRQSVQYGEDQLDIMSGLQSSGLPKESLAELAEWVRTADLDVAYISPDGVDNFPQEPGF